MMENEARGPMPNVDPTLQPGEVLLRVKSASHPSCEDLEFHAQASFSVRQIKEAIQRLSAHHPEIKEQRLIYSGHLLDDNQLLKDVLTANNGSQMSPPPPNQAVTIHLACTSKSFYSNTPSSSRIGGHKPGNNGHPGDAGIPQQPLFNNQGFPPANMGIPGGGGIPQDVLSLHQIYVEQMTAYMNNWYLYQGAMGGMFYQYPQPPVGNFVPPAAAPFQPQNNNVVPPNRAQADNIAAARAGDDDENQRDLLDWMYTLSRVVLVFSVVYFYSSFSRFLLVVVFTALVMVLQRRNGQANQNAEGAVPQRQARPQQNQPPQPPANRRNENAPVEGDVPAADRVDQIEGDGPNVQGLARPPTDENREDNQDQNEDEARQQLVAEPPQANIREVALTFLTTFFTSLIPETYQNN